MPGAKGRSGGARPGAGRPRTRPVPPPKPVEIDWRAVQEAAEAGAPEPEIIRALAIPEVALQDGPTLARFRDEITAGRARCRLELRLAIKARGKRTRKNDGSVNILALRARNELDWDKQLPAQEVEPDLGTARQRLADLLEKLAQARSETEGRTVTPLDLLHREAEAAESRLKASESHA